MKKGLSSTTGNRSRPEFGRTLAFHWRQALRNRRLVLISFVVGPLSIVLERYVAPLFIAILLTNIQQNNATLDNSTGLIIGYALAIFPAMILGYRIVLWSMWRTQIDTGGRLFKMSLNALLQQPLRFHNNQHSGTLVSQANKLATAFYEFWEMVIYKIMFVIVSVAATIIGVSLISWPISLAMLGLVIIFSISAYFGTRFIQPRQTARSKSYSRISGDISDVVNNITAIKTESSEVVELEHFQTSIDNMIVSESSVRKGTLSTTTAISTIVAVFHVVALIGAVLAVQMSAINAGAVFLIITYTFNLLIEISNINSAFRSAYKISGDTIEMLDILQLQPSITDTNPQALAVSRGSIDISSIHFHHEDSDDHNNLFKGLSLSISGGEKIGLVGPSGSGKTTLTRLLLRLIEPQSGLIEVDGQDIAEVSRRSLHQAIAFVSQEPLLFHRSLRDNIAYSRPDASDSEVIKAAKLAQCYEFIEALPNKFDTLVGERGVKLSGGQRQRVAIARAILKDAPILILDEATSALDSESEDLIQQSLEGLMNGRTSIVVAHRLSTIAKLDRIIVLDKGKIVEDGSHDELIKLGRKYAKLWKHQSGGFLTEA